MSTHILIVEDDENLRMAREDISSTRVIASPPSRMVRPARKELARAELDLVILDIMLPDVDGYTLCREIRERKMPVRVLMLTARSLESDLVTGVQREPLHAHVAVAAWSHTMLLARASRRREHVELS